MDITITKIYYVDILVNKFHREIKKQQRDLISADIILHHDNVSVHTSHLVSSAIHNLKYELFCHLLYSPDLVFSNYFLFPVLKNYLQGRHYNNRSLLHSSRHQCLNSMFEGSFTAAIQKLPERWQKCISVEK